MLHTQSQDKLLVYPSKDLDDLQSVYRLTYDTYLRRGICKPNPQKTLIHNPQLDQSPDTTILVARQKGEVVGTISLTKGYQKEDIYNYQSFASQLSLEPTEGGPFFSGWRLAIKGDGPSSRYLALQLILKGIQHLLQQDLTYGYMCFREEHLRFYKRILPEGYVVGRSAKQTNDIDTELCMWKCYLSEERYTFLHRMVLRMSQRS
ncbi:MAG: hypothetical protein AAFP02_16815 [Bacteroidota bacterium]